MGQTPWGTGTAGPTRNSRRAGGCAEHTLDFRHCSVGGHDTASLGMLREAELGVLCCVFETISGETRNAVRLRLRFAQRLTQSRQPFPPSNSRYGHLKEGPGEGGRSQGPGIQSDRLESPRTPGVASFGDSCSGRVGIFRHVFYSRVSSPPAASELVPVVTAAVLGRFFLMASLQ